MDTVPPTTPYQIMLKGTMAAILAMSVAGSAFAQTPSSAGGPVGGPNQAQSVVPSGATGGQSGGPNQAQFVRKSHKKHHHHH